MANCSDCSKGGAEGQIPPRGFPTYLASISKTGDVVKSAQKEEEYWWVGIR